MKKVRRYLGQWYEIIALQIILAVFAAQDAFGQDADRVVERAAEYLISRLGPAIFLFGIVVSGISLAAGSRTGVIRGIYTVIGGIIILAARAIFNSIRGFAG